MSYFFSIIIPCYNSSPYIAHMLQSIVDQHMPEDIQVILSDDCSTEPYDDQVAPFLDKLHIVRVSTDYNCCPGNTRQKGAQAATGEWICFADHDDEFLPDTLKKVKREIKKHNYKYYVRTTFHEIKRDTREIVQVVTADKGLSWNHGKFYNRKNLWQKYNIHFIKDLLSHEDVAITAQVNSIMVQNKLQESNLDIHTYNWLKNPESLSNKRYYWKNQTDRQRSFLQVFFIDYLTSTGWIYLQKLKTYLENPKEERDENYTGFLRDMTISSLLYGYYYTESFLQQQGPYFIRDNFIEAGKLLYETMMTMETSPSQLVMFLRSNIGFFDNIRNTALIATGPVIPKHGLEEWMVVVLFMYYPERQITIAES